MGGAEVDTDDKVFAVRLRGSFVGNSAPVPNGIPAPQGTYLLLVYDAATNELLDWGLRDKPQDLGELGELTPIKP